MINKDAMYQLVLKKDQIKPIRETVLETIREAIIEGKFKPGQQLIERELSETMGISTTPIKEAFRILSHEGLVKTFPRKGTFVSEIVDSSIEEVLLLKGNLEGFSARLAASKITKEELYNLENQLNLMEEFAKNKKTDQLNIANYKFHEIIRTAAKNPIVYQMLTTVISFDNAFRKRALKYNTEIEEGYREHKKIFEAIKAGEPEIAEDMMQKHIMRTTQNVLKNSNGS